MVHVALTCLQILFGAALVGVLVLQSAAALLGVPTTKNERRLLRAEQAYAWFSRNGRRVWLASSLVSALVLFTLAY